MAVIRHKLSRITYTIVLKLKREPSTKGHYADWNSRLAECLPCNGHIELILNFFNLGYTLGIDEDSARENKALFVKIIEDDSAAFDAKLSEDYSQDR